MLCDVPNGSATVAHNYPKPGVLGDYDRRRTTRTTIASEVQQAHYVCTATGLRWRRPTDHLPRLSCRVLASRRADLATLRSLLQLPAAAQITLSELLYRCTSVRGTKLPGWHQDHSTADVPFDVGPLYQRPLQLMQPRLAAGLHRRCVRTYVQRSHNPRSDSPRPPSDNSEGCAGARQCSSFRPWHSVGFFGVGSLPSVLTVSMSALSFDRATYVRADKQGAKQCRNKPTASSKPKSKTATVAGQD